MDDIYLRLKESAFKLAESAPKRYDYDAAGRCFSPIRVAFNKCRTSRERKGLDRLLFEYQAFYNLYNKDTKITNKKHHGFLLGFNDKGELVVICDDSKMRFVKECDIVQL
jgi:hypothetical protein